MALGALPVGHVIEVSPVLREALVVQAFVLSGVSRVVVTFLSSARR